ncbi:MAG: hypothetical protein ABSD74_14100 [Rhizomicrobium sp.]|jgi:hypothetical protein
MHSKLFLSTSALAIAGSMGIAIAASQPHGAPELPKSAVVVSSIDGIAVGVVLPPRVPKASGAAPNGLVPLEASQVPFNNLSKDRNAQFLSWYGFQLYGYAQSACSGSNCTYSSGYERLAIPIAGSGKSVTSILVPDTQVSGKGAKFTVALYSNTASGTPGKAVPGASGTASAVDSSSGYCCSELVSVKIPRTTLNAGTTYWIVENGAKQTGAYNSAFWLGETTDFTQAGKLLVQTHQYVTYDGFVLVNNTSAWQSTSEDKWTEPAAEVK